MTRESFQRQLHDTEQDVLVMGAMVGQAIERSVKSLQSRDMNLARQVVEDDQQINKLRFDIEEQCLLLIATQAPMASDLRILASAMHVSTELERMADHAAGIAQIALMVGNEPHVKPLIDIPRMSLISREMLQASLTAFIERDVAAAYRIALRDDEVDNLYNQVYRELLVIMLADPSTIDPATHLLWVAHNLERIADRVTNICERVIFLTTGKMAEIKSGTERQLERDSHTEGGD